jgi:hypothetical protein
VSDLAQRIRLFDRETGADIATLDDRDPNPVTWLSFSHDGTRLAVTRAERTAIWNLAALSRELDELGLYLAGLPADGTDTMPMDGHSPTSLEVNRGPLPPADRWYRLWQRLAEHEASERNWPDAIDDMNNGLFHVPNDAAVKAAFLAQRGTYLQRNLSFQAARSDWEAAIDLMPEQPTAATGLARLYVMGPPELRDPRRAVPLAAMLVLDDDSNSSGQLLQAMAKVRLGKSDPDTLQALELTRSNVSAGIGPDWRIAAGYFLVLGRLQEGDFDGAAEVFAAATRLHNEHRGELLLDQQQELTRLADEVADVLNVTH